MDINHQLDVCVRGTPEMIEHIIKINLWPVYGHIKIDDDEHYLTASTTVGYPFNDALFCAGEKMEGLVDIYGVKAVGIRVRSLDKYDNLLDEHLEMFSKDKEVLWAAQASFDAATPCQYDEEGDF
jgi:hypothetical protein